MLLFLPLPASTAGMALIDFGIEGLILSLCITGIGFPDAVIKRNDCQSRLKIDKFIAFLTLVTAKRLAEGTFGGVGRRQYRKVKSNRPFSESWLSIKSWLLENSNERPC